MAKQPDKKETFSAVEKEAMKARAAELRAEKAKAAKADPAGAFHEAVEALAEPERSMAKRLDALVRGAAPALQQKTFYGMPAWARPDKAGKVVCFFQSAAKFKVRYSTFGFQEAAALDEGTFWPTAYALTKLTPAVEARIRALVEQAARA
ncbi:MAG: hypothetical protein IT374_03085 [Polyangiaceae bacterium]|nr:hypothetical protein [Polyangiaceae bacterium]